MNIGLAYSSTLASFGPLGPWEIMIILVIALIFFGKRLPEVGKSLGKGIVEFKKGLSGIEEDVNSTSKAEPKSPPAPGPGVGDGKSA